MGRGFLSRAEPWAGQMEYSSARVDPSAMPCGTRGGTDAGSIFGRRGMPPRRHPF